MKGSNLSIQGVTAVDFHRKFMCLLASPQMEQGQTKLIVTLKPGTHGMYIIICVLTLPSVCIILLSDRIYFETLY